MSQSETRTFSIYSSAMTKIGNLEILDAVSSAIEKRLNGRSTMTRAT